ncbi:hypothetical protein OG698_03005 [Streptomyces sp. NBC_01003]|uniref:hypothetical protein n=1 Tax=Streptomyces sp. NBC_01003 TaxID=2903714 RepID=UPI00386B8660|nr:hypothetical protein OG698_03005 [Streptomyces sp. NBC_01003]
MSKPDKARELYDALRTLEGKAKAARRRNGRTYSRREAARTADRRDSSLDRRIGEWLHDDWTRAKTPSPASDDQLIAVVRVWSEWAGEPFAESTWSTLLEKAQPSRSRLARAKGASQGDFHGDDPNEEARDLGPVNATRRKDQRDTYTRLPQLVRDFQQAMPPIVGTPSRQQADETLRRLNAALVALEDGALQVELEGPQIAAQAAYAVVNQATDLFEMTIRFLHEITRAGGPSDRDALEDMIDLQTPRLVAVTSQFAQVASIVLNSPGPPPQEIEVAARPPRYVRHVPGWPPDVAD